MEIIQQIGNQHQLQATIDICFHLTYFRNLTSNKLGPLVISLNTYQSQNQLAIPYQIISKKTYNTTSKIDLQTYLTPTYFLNANQTALIDQIVIFKIHIPIQNIENGSFKCLFGLQTVDQLAYQKQQERKILDEIEMSFNTILHVENFIPVTFEKYGVCIQSIVYTHLLSCKYNNLNHAYRHHFYQTIDYLVISYNKLRQKINLLENQRNNYQFDQQNRKILNEFQLPLYINMNQHPEYEEIRSFIQKRIFKESTMKAHKQILIKFTSKFIPFMTEKLLLLWKEFLNIMSFDISNSRRTKFFETLTTQLKKRVQYRQQGYYQRSNNIKKRKQYLSNITFQIQPQIGDSIENLKNIKAFNHLRQEFKEESLYNPFKKISILNLQLPYPTIKILSHTKKKNDFIDNIDSQFEPHIIVLVHGLGASSTAFYKFQMSFKYIYGDISILNSICNEKFTDESIQQMGRNLAAEVQQFIFKNNFGQNFKLSFIGHSMGGLIIRSALPKLEKYRYNMKTLITLSTPHLGYFFHNSRLNKAGMWALSAFSSYKIINYLLMTEADNGKKQKQVYYRESFLYNLSNAKGMSWFQHVILFGSEDDYFVGPLSSLITVTQQIQQQNTLEQRIWEQMRYNLSDQLKQCSVHKNLVKFNDQLAINFKDNLLGKKSHILYLSSQSFIEYLLLVYKKILI